MGSIVDLRRSGNLIWRKSDMGKALNPGMFRTAHPKSPLSEIPGLPGSDKEDGRAPA